MIILLNYGAQWLIEVCKFEFQPPVFKKVTSAGLSSLQQKGYQILVKIWIFDDPFHKKRIVLVICVLGMIQQSSWVNFLMKWGCWGHWGHWGCRGCRGHWGCKGSKAWKITSEDFRVIPVLEFSFILMFWKKQFLVESWNMYLHFWRLLLCYFFENWLMKLKCSNLLNTLDTIMQ